MNNREAGLKHSAHNLLRQPHKVSYILALTGQVVVAVYKQLRGSLRFVDASAARGDRSRTRLQSNCTNLTE